MKIKVSVQEELIDLIKGINTVSSIKNDLLSKIDGEESRLSIEKVLNGEDVSSLSDDDKLKFMEMMFYFSRSDSFKPENALVSDDGSSIGRDKISSLYYNFNLKNSFASKYKESTRLTIMALFRKTEKIEKRLNKDLSNFTIIEYEEVLYSLKAKTIRSLQNYISTIEVYIGFANSNSDYINNFSKVFNNGKRISRYIDKEAEENMIFNRDEIMGMAMDADNAQDGVIIGLLFDGLSHKDGFEELIELTSDAIDGSIITLHNREVEISEDTKILTKHALRDDTYYSISGDKLRKYKLGESKHVLRGVRGAIKVKSQIISQRIGRISEHFGQKFLNATNISYSGQIHYAKGLLDAGCDMDQTIDSVIKRFGLTDVDATKYYLKKRIEKYLLTKKDK